jgi:predicted GNAT family acetyltransferase
MAFPKHCGRNTTNISPAHEIVGDQPFDAKIATKAFNYARHNALFVLATCPEEGRKCRSHRQIGALPI